jgi:hypothetical protein
MDVFIFLITAEVRSHANNANNNKKRNRRGFFGGTNTAVIILMGSFTKWRAREKRPPNKLTDGRNYRNYTLHCI